ncbi:TIR domain-containing protein, partial [Salmonella enterica]
MARKVFFSFQYDDVLRAMNVRNSNVINANPKVGFIDKAEFEKLERTGDSTVKAWIDAQLI